MIVVQRKLHRQGGSLMLVVPKLWADSQGLKADDIVQVRLNGELIMKPVKTEAGAKAHEDS